jgi:RNA polymerase primary sigma factor
MLGFLPLWDNTDTNITKVTRTDSLQPRSVHDAANLDTEALKDMSGRRTSAVESGLGDDFMYKLYFKEIGKVPLLTAEEELDLARRIQEGDDEARELMIKANLRLVVAIAKQYSHFGVPLLDLINEGNIGLMRAVTKYDPTRGTRFSTYGSFWIKQAIRSGLAKQARTIRVPSYLIGRLADMRRKRAELLQELEREPTLSELADEIGISEARVAQMHSVGLQPISLDQPIGDDDSAVISDVVPDDKVTFAGEQMDEAIDKDTVHRMLANLPSRETTILRYRFGFGEQREKTLDEVAELFGVTRERIRQIQERGLKRLRQMIQAERPIPLEA